MDDQLRAENEALRDLFEHPGWEVLMRNTKAQIEQFREGFPFNVNTLEQLYFSRGLLAALNALLTLPEQLEAAGEAAAQEDIPPEDQ